MSHKQIAVGNEMHRIKSGGDQSAFDVACLYLHLGEREMVEVEREQAVTRWQRVQ